MDVLAHKLPGLRLGQHARNRPTIPKFVIVNPTFRGCEISLCFNIIFPEIPNVITVFYAEKRHLTPPNYHVAARIIEDNILAANPSLTIDEVRFEDCSVMKHTYHSSVARSSMPSTTCRSANAQQIRATSTSGFGTARRRLTDQ
jgi:hypothetical protein